MHSQRNTMYVSKNHHLSLNFPTVLKNFCSSQSCCIALKAHLKYFPLTAAQQQPHRDLHLQDTPLKFNVTHCGHIALPFMFHPSLSLCSQYRKK